MKILYDMTKFVSQIAIMMANDTGSSLCVLYRLTLLLLQKNNDVNINYSCLIDKEIGKENLSLVEVGHLASS